MGRSPTSGLRGDSPIWRSCAGISPPGSSPTAKFGRSRGWPPPKPRKSSSRSRCTRPALRWTSWSADIGGRCLRPLKPQPSQMSVARCRDPVRGSSRGAVRARERAESRSARLSAVQLCSYHHRLVHEGGFGVQRAGPGALRLRRPDGRMVPEAPDCTPVNGQPLQQQQRRRGLSVSERTCMPRPAGQSLDYGIAVEGLLLRLSLRRE